MRNAEAIALAGIIALSACATPPKKIPAQYVSPNTYASYDCEQVTAEGARIERRTGELYHSLKKEASGDKWQMGVGLVLFWPALFALEGGDGPEAMEYGRLKGEYEALRQVSVQKKCGIEFSDDLVKTVAQEDKDEKNKNEENNSPAEDGGTLEKVSVEASGGDLATATQ